MTDEKVEALLRHHYSDRTKALCILSEIAESKGMYAQAARILVEAEATYEESDHVSKSDIAFLLEQFLDRHPEISTDINVQVLAVQPTDTKNTIRRVLEHTVSRSLALMLTGALLPMTLSFFVG